MTRPDFATRPDSASGRASRLKGALKLVFTGILVFATCGPAVDAEEENAAAFFRADRERMRASRPAARPVVAQRPTLMIRRAAPVRGYARAPAVHEPQPTRDATTPPPPDPAIDPSQVADGPPVVAPPPQPAKPVEPVFTVAVIGDSLGQLLGQGLTEAFADRPEIAILRKARENTGLVRDDYFDWTKGARDIAGGPDRINLAIMMIGSNDRQAVRDGGTSVELRSPRWQQAYGDRIEAIVKAFADKSIPMVWVGLPVMKNDRYSADMAAFNEIVKQRLAKSGAAYVDTWEAFLDDRGLYAPYGPDVNGQFQKLRSADGVHFTKPGARKLAYYLEAEIRRAVEAARPKVEVEIAAITSKPEPPAAPTAGVPLPPQRGSGDALIILPAPAAPAEIVIPVKPAEGAVVALNATVVSPGGRLAAPSRVTASDAQALLDRVFLEGRPLDAKPGRADDFSWPRK